MDPASDSDKKPSSDGSPPSPGTGVPAAPASAATSSSQDLPVAEPLEEAPEPLEEPPPKPRRKTGDTTAIRKAVTEKGHGSTARSLPALVEPFDLPKRHNPETPSTIQKALDELPTVEELDFNALSDEDLMRMCQEGDEGAFEVLFHRFEAPALSFINRLIGDRNRTEALGQEAFLRIYKDAKSYQYPRSFATWFYTIVRNLCKNELRWRSRHPTVSIEENVGGGGRSDSDGQHIGDSLRAEANDPLDQMMSEELTKKLDTALKDLPELERDILILKCYQGLKYREIAEVVGVPVGTVRSRIHAALERLRKQVKEYL